MSDSRQATPDHPIHDLMVRRWSPYVFADRPVEPAKLARLFEAARWAASSFNEQPWRYILATKADGAGYEAVLNCLVEANQAWAKFVPALALGCVKKTFSRNGKPNRVCEHDLGLANAQLTLQAMELGLHIHMMAGIEPSRIRATFKVPDDFEPLVAVAIGYHGQNPQVPDDIAKRDTGTRQRKPLSETVFAGEWGKAAPLS
jgi:nitroreductase